MSGGFSFGGGSSSAGNGSGASFNWGSFGDKKPQDQNQNPNSQQNQSQNPNGNPNQGPQSSNNSGGFSFGQGNNSQSNSSSMWGNSGGGSKPTSSVSDIWGSGNSSNPKDSSGFGMGRPSSSNGISFNFPSQAISNGNKSNPMMKMKQLFGQYDPNNPECRFECILYNKIPANSHMNVNKPPLIRPQVWENGIKQNPKPRLLMPVGIRGYQHLLERGNLCLAGHVSCNKAYSELNEKMMKLNNKINTYMKQQILTLKRTQQQLSYRLLHVLRQYIEIQSEHDNPMNNTTALQVQLHSSSLNASSLNDTSISGIGIHDMTLSGHAYLNADEVRLKNNLQNIQQESRRMFQEFSRMDDSLGSSFGDEYSMKHKYQSLQQRGGTQQSSHAMITPSRANMKKMFDFLRGQQQFIQHMSKTVVHDLEELDIVMKGLCSSRIL